jgi:hypothetical protein
MSTTRSPVGPALALLLTLVPATLGGSMPAGATESPWQVVPSPSVGPARSELHDVAAVAADDAWAVGSFFDQEEDADRLLIEHWDGRSWTVVPAPNVGAGWQGLSGVAAVSSRDVWAVGATSERFGPQHSLLLRWNGRRWKVVTAPLFEKWDALEDVSAVSARDAWAVGNSYLGGFIIRWDGRSWSVVPSPNVGWLTSIHAVSANDVWAVGGTYQTLVLHWDGMAWRVVPSPSPATDFSLLEDVSGGTAEAVWAVGSAWQSTQPRSPLIERWDGTGWRMVPGPDLGATDAALFAVAAPSPSSAWAVGAADGGTLILRWDGVGWVREVSPSPGVDDGLLGTAATAAGQPWAVGTSRDGAAARTLTLRRAP